MADFKQRILGLYVWTFCTYTQRKRKPDTLLFVGLALTVVCVLSTGAMSCRFWSAHRAQMAVRVPFRHPPPALPAR
ncbi:hypothetical protein C8F04DRAFT_1266415 [Mycena alexandri]|uniref:Uncharacterized protein n=1 Tax=Mycena alexandri TaxID=1745969 RepID=A0AAD6WX87_9AGAR|nr:hypothetical protein C8F04DRAFT_1266415 [Mycena alexandri]